MGSRLILACVSLVALVSAMAAGAQQNPYRLKEPDQRKLCVACHDDFARKLAQPVVHTAVKSGECTACHDPHVSSHGKLLASDTRQICSTCHEGIIPANARSAHKVVAEGECQKCHDPHASANAGVLVAKGTDLCFSCHKDLGEAIATARFKHTPVGQGCLTCHGPHASETAPGLLKTAVPALCVGCHKPDSPAFVARHVNYPVGKASCTSCHDPHASSQPALLLNTVHQPVSTRACAQCHEAADSPTPFAVKRTGFDLCKGCHTEVVNTTLAKARLHWPVADKTGCVNCHNPHASRQPKLLKADTLGLCGSCHAETVKRIATMPVKHEPVSSGTCVSCHSPHAANGVYLVDQPSVNELCTTCHDYETHSAHPIGEKAVDQRNKNLRVDCLSCHDAHGNQFKHMLLAPTNLELCTQCHKEYVR